MGCDAVSVVREGTIGVGCGVRGNDAREGGGPDGGGWPVGVCVECAAPWWGGGVLGVNEGGELGEEGEEKERLHDVLYDDQRLMEIMNKQEKRRGPYITTTFVL